MCFSLFFLSYSLAELLKRPHKAAAANILRVNHKVFVWYCFKRLKSNYKHFLNVKVPFLTITKRFFLANSLHVQCLPFLFIDLCISPQHVNQRLGSSPLMKPIFLTGFVRMFLHIYSTVGVFFAVWQAAPSWTLFLPSCSPRMCPTHRWSLEAFQLAWHS